MWAASRVYSKPEGRQQNRLPNKARRNKGKAKGRQHQALPEKEEQCETHPEKKRPPPRRPPSEQWRTASECAPAAATQGVCMRRSRAHAAVALPPPARARGGVGTGEKDGGGAARATGRHLSGVGWLAGVLLPLQWQRCWTQEAAPSLPASLLSSTHAGRAPSLSRSQAASGEVMQHPTAKGKS